MTQLQGYGNWSFEFSVFDVIRGYVLKIIFLSLFLFTAMIFRSISGQLCDTRVEQTVKLKFRRFDSQVKNQARGQSLVIELLSNE